MCTFLVCPIRQYDDSEGEEEEEYNDEGGNQQQRASAALRAIRADIKTYTEVPML